MAERRHYVFDELRDSPVIEDSLEVESIREYDLGRYQQALEMLPARWQDFLGLEAAGHKQLEIAAIFGCTQPNVWYYLSRARRAIKFYLTLPEISEESIESDLSSVLPREEVLVLRYFYRTSCVVHTCKLLGWTVHRTRIVERTVRELRSKVGGQPDYEKYVVVFERLLANKKVWADIRSPIWDTGQAAKRDLRPDEVVPLPPVSPNNKT